MSEHEILNTPKSKEQIKLIGILHFAWNIVSWGLLGTILVIWYLIWVNNITPEAKKTIYQIINFNLSFLLYMFISFLLMVILIWFLMLWIGAIIWFVALVIWFIKHLSWETYEYPLTIKFLK